ncbi:MAG: hypothetical protein M3Z11_03170 [Candidatus Dormibacteraeota bacterium]|nr:hypothetical protein [Candidatus Dormibacteraeota bacterium]
MRRQLLISLAAATTAAAFGGIVTASADTQAGYTCTNKSGGVSGVPGTVSAIRVAHQTGYDRLVIEFAPSAAGAIPAYTLTRQASSTFVRDASGQPVKLDGSAGIKAVFQNTAVGSGVRSDIKAALPEIREVANIGNFERVTSYGVGLATPACFRVAELTMPMRLVIDVQTPTAAPAALPVSATPAASAAPATQVAANSPSDLATTGHAQTPVPSSGLPLAQIALGLLVLTGGLTLAGLRLIARK